MRRQVLVAGVDGLSFCDPEHVLSGRRYAAVRRDLQGGIVTFVGEGSILSGPVVLSGPVDDDDKDNLWFVCCKSCHGEVEISGPDDPLVAPFVRDHRCDQNEDLR